MKHSISRQEIVAVLQHRGFHNVDERPRKYAESYLHSASGELVNVKTNDSNPLVIHPGHEGQVQRLLAKSGVIRGGKRFSHNSAFYGFPDRINGGSTPERYGIDFGFSSTAALDAFLDVLLASNTHGAPTAEEDIDNATDLPIDETERETVIAARRGQGRFRKSLDSMWETCAVTGCANTALLRASHIKPWRDSDNRDRLFPYNGLLLAAHIDAAFDKGLISFDDDGCILIDKSRLSDEDSKVIGIHPRLKLRDIHEMHKPYLAEHRRLHRFKG